MRLFVLLPHTSTALNAHFAVELELSHLQGMYHGVPAKESQFDFVFASSQDFSPLGVLSKSVQQLDVNLLEAHVLFCHTQHDERTGMLLHKPESFRYPQDIPPEVILTP